MPDYALMFLIYPGQEAGNILKGDERNIKAIAKPHKSGSLYRGIDIKDTGQESRLIRYYSN